MGSAFSQASSIAFLLNAFCFCLLARVSDERVLLGLFLVRGGLANGAIPIDRSIVMDYATESARAYSCYSSEQAHKKRSLFLLCNFVILSIWLYQLPLL